MWTKSLQSVSLPATLLDKEIDAIEREKLLMENGGDSLFVKNQFGIPSLLKIA